MTTRYRVEYALKRVVIIYYGWTFAYAASKSHRRDQLIEWIKGLMAVPFVLHSQPMAVVEAPKEPADQDATVAQRRYVEIMRDVEELINDYIAHQRAGTQDRSKLKLLVPTVGIFFTPLNLHDAFLYQDSKRAISSRRFVAPSFNDIRLIMNTAQVMSIVSAGPLELVTLDGDVTLYDDGKSLEPDSPVIPRLMNLLERGTRIGIVTAAGYTEASKYYDRLHGLLNAVHVADLPASLKQNLVVMGGESSYLFQYSSSSEDRLRLVPREQWLLDEMKMWQDVDVTTLLDLAEIALKDSLKNLRLDGDIIRKERAVGIIPKPGQKFPREALEETVLAAQKVLDLSAVGQRLPFCAFNGGSDVFVDIGDKSWGVRACQRFFGTISGTEGIEGGKTLHIGDQFLSAGANDFKARLACTTAWIASPSETVELIDEIGELGNVVDRKKK